MVFLKKFYFRNIFPSSKVDVALLVVYCIRCVKWGLASSAFFVMFNPNFVNVCFQHSLYILFPITGAMLSPHSLLACSRPWHFFSMYVLQDSSHQDTNVF